ncbi:hypothetical protein F2Q68_00005069 [Brassica cretica]|uniref:Uncharacterized protein n=1 Tax=Brassica cretica TaxID=69181 RepID=A0A8S9J866_BRACR|nr:hypothetical protein F2Q68_00005069 [Brassica cretica]
MAVPSLINAYLKSLRDPKFIQNPSAIFMPALGPASTSVPPQKTSELQAPPFPRRHQKSRASHLLLETSGSIAPDPGLE